jgi:2-polyprenyl-3-methyl-5-hydroxy-6-metoxy-1,4-benzoquinol methylase
MDVRRRHLRLPPAGLAPKTHADDPVDYYYKPLTGRLYRARLRLVADLLGESRFASLLEIGYGSGIFLPELARRADRLVAIDVHGQSQQVEKMLGRVGVSAELVDASLFELPFADAEFDALVCVSVLEHITELHRALDAFRRVLVPGGVAVLGFPIRNPLTDSFFRLVGYDPRDIHPSGHKDILRAVESHPGFALDVHRHIPRFLPLPISAYAGCRCRAL